MDDLIDFINKRLDNSLNVTEKNISLNTVQNNLLNKIRLYRRDINLLQNSLYSQARLKKLKVVEINHYSLVACAIGAKYNDWSSFGSSNSYIKIYSNFFLLYHRLIKLGQIGTKSKKRNKNGRKNTIGKCAEIKAAYNINSKVRILNLKDIEFTKAYKPRTQQIIDRCENCKFTFGEE